MLDCDRGDGNNDERRGTSSGNDTTRRTCANRETNGEYYIGGSAGHLRGTIRWRLPTLAATTSTIVATVAAAAAMTIATTGATVIAAAAATAPILSLIHI